MSPLRRRARLGAESQAMNHSLLLDTDERQMERWAHAVTAASSLEGELQWWETVAAGASTPALGALVALAAQPGATEGDFLAVEGAYFPWVNALNTLLDSLVDLDEDPSQQRHIERYGSPQAAAERLAAIAARSRAGVCKLAGAQQHELILAAMGGLLPGTTCRLAWGAQSDGRCGAGCARAVRALDTHRAQAAPRQAGNRPARSPRVGLSAEALAG